LNVIDVPVQEATAESLEGFGHIVHSPNDFVGRRDHNLARSADVDVNFLYHFQCLCFKLARWLTLRHAPPLNFVGLSQTFGGRRGWRGCIWREERDLSVLMLGLTLPCLYLSLRTLWCACAVLMTSCRVCPCGCVWGVFYVCVCVCVCACVCVCIVTVPVLVRVILLCLFYACACVSAVKKSHLNIQSGQLQDCCARWYRNRSTADSSPRLSFCPLGPGRQWWARRLKSRNGRRIV